MKATSLVSAAALALLVSAAASAAEALPKKGMLSGVFGWHYAAGKNIEIEKDHIIWGGVAAGPFVGDGAQGLLHGAAASCTFSGEFKKDTVTHSGGDCVVVDADGDKVVLNWKCTKCPNGEMAITHGTGKYAGIKGAGTYEENLAGPFDSDSGWSVWKVKWERP
jgi:hypothetical protein